MQQQCCQCKPSDPCKAGTCLNLTAMPPKPAPSTLNNDPSESHRKFSRCLFCGCASARLCADLLQLCRGRTQKVRVLCTGALTNVALLVSLYPEVIPRVEIVLMGGAMGLGNTGPVMEFNIQVGQGLLQYQLIDKQHDLHLASKHSIQHSC